MNNLALLLLFALASPLPLIGIEKFLPFPFVIEELVKLLLVVLTIHLLKKKSLTKYILIEGFLFSLSESIFYLFNIMAIGKYSLFFDRLVLVSAMHMATIFVMYYLGKKGTIWLVLGFFLAMCIHFFYNLLIPLIVI